MYSQNAVPAATPTKKAMQALSKSDFEDLLTNHGRRLARSKKAEFGTDSVRTCKEVARSIYKDYAEERGSEIGNVKSHNSGWSRGEDRWVSEKHWTMLVKLSRMTDLKNVDDDVTKGNTTVTVETAGDSHAVQYGRRIETTRAIQAEQFRKMVNFILRLSSACSEKELGVSETVVLVYRWSEIARLGDELEVIGLSQSEFEKQMPAACITATGWREEVSFMK